ncbi:hypothetical protein ACFRMN_19300 [Streptomyces sp. NPDC056835]|uniref:hypothetical protein n=1 Tax=Streptomyces sp. NPDC056835 TaxID=3345956 RepID=UPI0036AB530D
MSNNSTSTPLTLTRSQWDEIRDGANRWTGRLQAEQKEMERLPGGWPAGMHQDYVEVLRIAEQALMQEGDTITAPVSRGALITLRIQDGWSGDIKVIAAAAEGR